MTLWLDWAGVKTLFIAESSPWENGYAESFNSRLRAKLLNRELFISLEEVRWLVDRRRLDYNHHQPHSTLNYRIPKESAARCLLSTPQFASATPPQAPQPRPKYSHRHSRVAFSRAPALNS